MLNPTSVIHRLLCGVVLALAGTAGLADEPALTVELNRLDSNATACRAYLLLENRAGTSFRDLKLDLVMFDPDGVVARRLMVDVAPLPAGKTSLKVFDIADLACDGIGRMLVNDVAARTAENGDAPDCLGLLRVGSRAAIPLIK